MYFFSSNEWSENNKILGQLETLKISINLRYALGLNPAGNANIIGFVNETVNELNKINKDYRNHPDRHKYDHIIRKLEELKYMPLRNYEDSDARQNDMENIIKYIDKRKYKETRDQFSKEAEDRLNKLLDTNNSSSSGFKKNTVWDDKQVFGRESPPSFTRHTTTHLSGLPGNPLSTPVHQGLIGVRKLSPSEFYKPPHNNTTENVKSTDPYGKNPFPSSLSSSSYRPKLIESGSTLTNSGGSKRKYVKKPTKKPTKESTKKPAKKPTKESTKKPAKTKVAKK